MKFIRRHGKRFLRLGKKKKSKLKWRRPKGRDNKMREREKGYPKSVSLGYKQSKENRGKIGNLIPLKIKNIDDLSKIKKENIAVLCRMGKKKKLEIAKKGKEIKWLNFNLKKLLKEEERKGKKEKEAKEKSKRKNQKEDKKTEGAKK